MGKGFLRLTGLTAGGFLSLTAPLAPRVVDCPAGNTYKVSVTGFAFPPPTVILSEAKDLGKNRK